MEPPPGYAVMRQQRQEAGLPIFPTPVSDFAYLSPDIVMSCILPFASISLENLLYPTVSLSSANARFAADHDSSWTRVGEGVKLSTAVRFRGDMFRHAWFLQLHLKLVNPTDLVYIILNPGQFITPPRCLRSIEFPIVEGNWARELRPLLDIRGFAHAFQNLERISATVLYYLVQWGMVEQQRIVPKYIIDAPIGLVDTTCEDCPVHESETVVVTAPHDWWTIDMAVFQEWASAKLTNWFREGVKQIWIQKIEGELPNRVRGTRPVGPWLRLGLLDVSRMSNLRELDLSGVRLDWRSSILRQLQEPRYGLPHLKLLGLRIARREPAMRGRMAPMAPLGVHMLKLRGPFRFPPHDGDSTEASVVLPGPTILDSVDFGQVSFRPKGFLSLCYEGGLRYHSASPQVFGTNQSVTVRFTVGAYREPPMVVGGNLILHLFNNERVTIRMDALTVASGGFDIHIMKAQRCDLKCANLHSAERPMSGVWLEECRRVSIMYTKDPPLPYYDVNTCEILFLYPQRRRLREESTERDWSNTVKVNWVGQLMMVHRTPPEHFDPEHSYSSLVRRGRTDRIVPNGAVTIVGTECDEMHVYPFSIVGVETIQLLVLHTSVVRGIAYAHTAEAAINALEMFLPYLREWSWNSPEWKEFKIQGRMWNREIVAWFRQSGLRSDLNEEWGENENWALAKPKQE